jgi:hypothetical protein
VTPESPDVNPDPLTAAHVIREPSHAWL